VWGCFGSSAVSGAEWWVSYPNQEEWVPSMILKVSRFARVAQGKQEETGEPIAESTLY